MNIKAHFYTTTAPRSNKKQLRKKYVLKHAIGGNIFFYQAL